MRRINSHHPVPSTIVVWPSGRSVAGGRSARPLIALLLAAVALLTFAPSAHADTVPYTATCTGLTVTAPAGMRLHVSIDNEPPFAALVDGATGTYSFFQMSDSATNSHGFLIVVRDMVTDEKLDFVRGTVGPCETVPFPPPPVPPRAAAKAVDHHADSRTVAAPVAVPVPVLTRFGLK